MTMAGIEHFPNLGDWTEAELDALGYKKQSISVFDHVLTADEWDACPVTSPEKAKRLGVYAEYVAQDRAFLRFYAALMERGAYRCTGRNQCYGEMQVVRNNRFDRRLKKAINRAIQGQG